MQATAIEKSPAIFQNGFEKQPRYVSWEEFKRRYLNRENGFKYEWVRGEVIKTKRVMFQTQSTILANLRDLFTQLIIEKKVTGYLEAEMETFFLKGESYRRPDLSFFTKKQMALAAYGQEQIPAFVIEVISTNDQLNQLEDKMEDYWAAGVQVVWKIFPRQKTVHVCKGNEMTRCKGDDFCSAAPVLPDFVIKASDIFKQPPQPED